MTLLQAIAYGPVNQPGNYSPPVPTVVVDAGAAHDAALDAQPDSNPSVDAAGGDDSGGGDDAGSLASADLDVLFRGIHAPNVRITRMRSDVAKAALSADMSLEASSDQTEFTNQHDPTKEIGEPQCPVYDSHCNQTGTVPRSQAKAAASGGCSTTPPREGFGTALVCLLGAGSIFVRVRRTRGRRA